MSRPLAGRPGVIQRVLLKAAAVLLLALASCEGGDFPSSPEPNPDPPRPASILLSAISLEYFSLHEATPVVATVGDQYGATMTDQTVAWSTSDPQVASVTASGVVEAIGNGSAIITASVGAVSATVQVAIRQVVVSIRFEDAVVTLTTGSGPVGLEAIGEDANGYRAPLGALAWVSSDPDVSTVDETGSAIGVTPGWAIVLVTGESAAGSTAVHVVSPGSPGSPPDMRALHLGGNWLGNQLWAGVPHPDYLDLIEDLDVNWVGVSVALHYGESTDPVVRRVYDGNVTRTFTDEVLRTILREFRSRGINVYVTLPSRRNRSPDPTSRSDGCWACLGWMAGSRRRIGRGSPVTRTMMLSLLSSGTHTPHRRFTSPG